MRKRTQLIFWAAIIASSCNQNKLKTDASGVFESDEVIVSAEQSGKILSFPINEVDTLHKGAVVGNIDVTNVLLQKQQVQATILALHEKTTNPQPQVALVKKQLAVQQSQ
ncbi:MAG: HlyD family secretion protein, partial [Bacteroidota bacterium]